MITQSEVNYSEEIIENLSVSDIREIYAESLLRKQHIFSIISCYGIVAPGAGLGILPETIIVSWIIREIPALWREKYTVLQLMQR